MPQKAKKKQHALSPISIVREFNQFRFQNYGRIPIPNGNRIDLIKLENISSFRSSGNYVYIHFNNGKQTLVSKPLKWVEEHLNDFFLRVHNSYIVNLLEVKSYLISENALLLIDGSTIPVSRSKKASINQLFK